MRGRTGQGAGRLVALVVVSMLAVSVHPAAGATPPAVYSQLANGATLIVSEQPVLPVVIIQVTLDAGARWDPAGQEGVASLTADMLAEGTKTRSASQISETTDFIGASLGAGADMDLATVSAACLKKDLATTVALLSDVLMHPAFAEEEMTRQRAAVLAGIQSDEDRPGSLANKAFQRALFGTAPYGHPVEGTAKSVAGLRRADVERFYAARYRPQGAIITVVGDVTAAEIQADLGGALARWDGGAPSPFVAPPALPPTEKVVRIDKPITQANIVVGHHGVARGNPDYYAITVMNYILGGGGFSSRLLDNIRTRAGLAYSVASFFTVNQTPGSFQVVMQTKSASAADAISRARAEIDRVRQEPVADDELAEAKRYLTGSFPLRLDSNQKIAAFLSQVAFFGLGRDYADTYAAKINSVTREDVQRVAKQYLQPDQLVLVAVGNLAAMQLPESGLVSAPPPDGR